MPRRPPTARRPSEARPHGHRPAPTRVRHDRATAPTAPATAPAGPGRPGSPTAWRPAAGSARRRLIAILLAVAVVFSVLTVRVADLQTRAGDRLAAMGEGQRRQTVPIAAERGAIFDRNGYDLALSIERPTIYADPRVVRSPAEYAARLAPIVGVDEIALRVKLAQPNSAFAYVARKVEPDVADAVRALRLPGVGFLSEPKRYYPAGELSAPVLGFVGLDNNGLSGVEQALEGTLAGRPGRLAVERDPTGTELPGTARTVTDARRGVDLVLTLDRSIQWETERALVEQVASTDAKGGMAIVIDVRTGDVLAMATVDGETATEPARPAPSTQRNRPVTDVFEPGSTNKVVTMAAALEAGLVTPETELAVPSAITVDGTEFADVEPHGPVLSITDILRVSSNVGTILTARKLGGARLDAALRNFGFGATTGIGFPGEAPGILLPFSQYNDTSLASIPIGNGLAVTALQMLEVYATLANDGVARPPRLIAATIDADGRRAELPTGVGRRVVSSTTAAQLREMLATVVQSGTGFRAAVPGYTVGGKTGTARKPPYERPPYKYVVSFAGFAPVESPRLAAIVVLDEAGLHSGGSAAAPVFSRVMQHALAVERVPGSTGTLRPLP